MLSSSTCKVPLSNIPPFPYKVPLPPLSPVMEHRGDGAIAAEDEDDPGDEILQKIGNICILYFI